MGRTLGRLIGVGSKDAELKKGGEGGGLTEGGRWKGYGPSRKEKAKRKAREKERT